jgi:neuraminyllactose-binding hemagglutinin
MTYLDKKDSYLALVPTITFDFRRTNVASKSETFHYSEKGTLSISGEFIVKVVEPVTGQAFINKRISLSEFALSAPYVYEKQTSDGSQLDAADRMIQQMNAPKGLTDNTEKVMQDLLNKFYAQAVKKIVAYVTRAELMAIEKDVLELKRKKVY